MASIERTALKSAARSELRGNLGLPVVILILYTAILCISGPTCVGPALLTGPLSLGLAGVFLMLARGEKPGVNRLFDGFKSFVGAFVAFLLSAIFTILWTCLFVVPGIVAAIRYSQIYFILKDHPELDGLEAIKKSKEMMLGHKGEYFVLLLSFFWWFCFGVVTLGIGFLYVCPYVNLTLAHYYEELKKQAD